MLISHVQNHSSSRFYTDCDNRGRSYVPFVTMPLHHICLSQGGWTALIYAAANGRADSARLLIDAGADKNTKDRVRDVWHVDFPRFRICARAVFFTCQNLILVSI